MGTRANSEGPGEMSQGLHCFAMTKSIFRERNTKWRGDLSPVIPQQ